MVRSVQVVGLGSGGIGEDRSKAAFSQHVAVEEGKKESAGAPRRQ